MKTHALALILVIVLTSSAAYAQSKEQGIGYFSKDWEKVTSPTQAAYYRTVQAVDTGYVVRDYFVPSGKLHVVLECSQILPDPIFHGKLKRYYENGTLEEEGQFDRAFATGIFVKYYDTGMPRERREYQPGGKDRIIQYYTPDGREQILNGKGVIPQVDDSGRPFYAEIEEYAIAFSYRVEAGDTLYTRVEKEAEYPGGMVALMNYLAKTVKYPPKARQKRIQGTVFTAFVVDKTGQISDTYTFQGVSPELDAEALRVIRAMKNWQPAAVRGKGVRSRFVLPIKFKLA